MDTNEGKRLVRVAAPLRMQLIEELHAALEAGRFAPGQRLVESDLCQMFGVSRTLVREALRCLEAEGIVAVVPNKGPIVATTTAEEARDLYAVRAVLEGMASKLFAETATEQQRADFREVFSDFAEACRQPNRDDILTAKTRLYACLLAGSGNKLIGSLLRPLQLRISLLRATSLSKQGRSMETLAEMQRIMDAIERRDGQAAFDANVAHIEEAAKAAIPILQAASPSQEKSDPKTIDQAEEVI